MAKLIFNDGTEVEIDVKPNSEIVRYHQHYFSMRRHVEFAGQDLVGDDPTAFDEGFFEWLEPQKYLAYMLFIFSDDRPKGGYRDFAGMFETFDEAEAKGRISPLDHFQIVDIKNCGRVYTCRTDQRINQDNQSAGSGAGINDGWNDGRV